MFDFSVFDSILDCAFVVEADGKIVYCNEPAATLAQVSVRRVVGKAKISELITVAEPDLLPFGPGSRGFGEPTPFIETDFTIVKAGRSGVGQLAIRPVDEKHWAFFLRDVSLEAALHAKYRSELSQKEEYARNLEQLVEARTAELRRVNNTLGAILDSLGQGFFTFDAAGKCGNVHTRACATVLGGIPADRPVSEVLALCPNEVVQFEKWSDTLFNEFLPFDDLRSLGPARFGHDPEREVTLEYYPLRREDASISEVVVVATDKTAEFAAQRALETERQYAAMVVKYTKNKDQFLRFLASVRPALEKVVTLASTEMTAHDVNEAFRALHTLEGEAGAFSLRDLRQATREAQTILEPWRGGERGPDEASRLRLRESGRGMLDAFEAFLAANRDVIRMHEGAVGRSVEVPVADVKNLLADVRALAGGDALAATYADRLLSEPIGDHLRYFDGLMQSVAEKLGKHINPLVVEGGDVRIDPDRYETFFSSLVHLFRNAIDHGLETPLEREWADKPPAGTVRVAVKTEGQRILFCFSDDGRGIDPARIRAKLREKFPGEDHDSPSDHQIIQSVCRPGFSSREDVGEFSGRGVGLDALREEVVRLGGTLVVKSKLNEGTTIEVDLPYQGNSAVLLKGA